MISQPPTAMTATCRAEVKNSIVAWNMPISLWNSRLETLKRSLEWANLSISMVSFAKALAVRKPESEDSISALMPAVRCLTILETLPIFRRRRITTERQMGNIRQTTRASFHWTVNMMIMAPITVRIEVTRSSGP